MVTYGALPRSAADRRRPSAAPPGARAGCGRLGVDRGRGGRPAAPTAPAGPPGWAPTGTAGRRGGGSSVARSSRPRAYPRGPAAPCSGCQRTGASHTCSGSATVRVRPALQQPGVLAHQHVDGLDRRPHAGGRARSAGPARPGSRRRAGPGGARCARPPRRPTRPRRARRVSLLRTAAVRDSAGTPQVAPDHLRPLVGRAAVDHQRHVARGEGPADRAGGLQRAELDPLARVRQRRHRLGHEQHAGGADAGDHEDGR